MAFSLFENFTFPTLRFFQRKMNRTVVFRKSLHITSLFGRVLDATTEDFLTKVVYLVPLSLRVVFNSVLISLVLLCCNRAKCSPC